VKFTDVTADSGIKFIHVNGAFGKKLLPETMGGGVAIIDFDNDGKPDILFINSCYWPGFEKEGKAPTLALYRNKGNFQFEDVTEKCWPKHHNVRRGGAGGELEHRGRPRLLYSRRGG